MTVLSPKRLKTLLATLDLDLEQLRAVNSDFARLHRLGRQQERLHHLQLLIGEVERTIGQTVGWPRLIVELDDYDLEFVSRSDAIDALVAARKISAEDGQWLNLELRERLARWWRAARAAGLPGLRRRELKLAAQNQAELAGFLEVPAVSIDGVFVRLAILAATAEAEPVADALANLAAALAPHAGLES